MNVSVPRGLLARSVNASSVLDLRFRAGEHDVRFTSALDAEAQRFERELLSERIVPCSDRVDEDGSLTSETGCVELQLQQRVAWLRQLGSDVRLLQMRGPRRRPAMQAAILLKRLRWRRG